MSARSLPYPGTLIARKFTADSFVREEDSNFGVGECTLEALVDEPLLVTWVEHGSSTLGCVHVMHPSGWFGWRAWADNVAAGMRSL